MLLQQYLPLAVLKLGKTAELMEAHLITVATVLTACGIETIFMNVYIGSKMSVATVLTACGIETLFQLC